MNHFALRKPQEIHFKGCWISDEVGELLLREIHPENAPSQALTIFVMLTSPYRTQSLLSALINHSCNNKFCT